MSKTTTERVRALRQRRKAEGLVRVEVWLRPEQLPLLHRWYSRLQKAQPLRESPVPESA